MKYKSNPASTTWELALIPNVLAGTIWVWNKPHNVNNSVAIQIPAETIQGIKNMGRQGPLTIGEIVNAIEFNPTDLHSVSIDSKLVSSGINPDNLNVALNTPLTVSAPDKELVIHLSWLAEPQNQVKGQHPQQTPAPTTYAAPDQPSIDDFQIVGQRTPKRAPTNQMNKPGAMPAKTRVTSPPNPASQSNTQHTEAEIQQLFNNMSGDWTGTIQVERQLEAMRKQLDSMISRLGSLNRDLNPKEAMTADSNDKRQWQDARRWLRDAMTNINRYAREYDVGLTSNAGLRLKLEACYKEYVVPKIPFADMQVMAKEFEAFRKMVQNLYTTIQSTITSANRDAENRARTILNTISAKSRRRK